MSQLLELQLLADIDIKIHKHIFSILGLWVGLSALGVFDMLIEYIFKIFTNQSSLALSAESSN